ncbi:unnamed protein product, partial [Didymodactylos carnosus]
EPSLIKNIDEKLLKPETILINSAIVLMTNLIYETTILGHVKQKQVTSTFLTLTNSKNDTIQLNAYMMLAYIMNEDDLKKMTNPGKILSAITDILRRTLQSGDGQERNNKIDLLTASLK